MVLTATLLILARSKVKSSENKSYIFFHCISSSSDSTGGTRDATAKAVFHKIVHIGTGCDYEVEISGYLHAYANDNWGSYSKNKGFMEMTIERLADSKPLATGFRRENCASRNDSVLPNIPISTRDDYMVKDLLDSVERPYDEGTEKNSSKYYRRVHRGEGQGGSLVFGRLGSELALETPDEALKDGGTAFMS